MRTIIAASRGFKTTEEVDEAIERSGVGVTETILTGLVGDRVVETAAAGVPQRRYDVKNEASRSAMLNRAGAAIIVTDGEDSEITDLIETVSGAAGPIDVFIDLKAAEVQIIEQGEINE